jgi:hypothetical protein
MHLNFNMLLSEAGIYPGDVRLLRHQIVASDGLTPYAVWRDNVPEFERFQSAQLAGRRAYFDSRYWAGFVVPPDGSTLFVGLYEIGERKPAPMDWIDPLLRASVAAMQRDIDIYQFQRLASFDAFIGRLKIQWGDGKRSWAQKADGSAGAKPIIELSASFREPDFPGYTRFLETLASLRTLPLDWATALRAAKGIYLLTCPRTKEQYVGAANGVDGFWGRWQSYIATGHGGNVGLKSRDPSDYQVSILEVAGSAATGEEISAMEQLWKEKLQSRDMGLNRN